MASPKLLRNLVTVEEAFQISGIGLIVVPGPPPNFFSTEGHPYFCSVLIQRPDGSTLEAQAEFHIPLLAVRDPEMAMRRRMKGDSYNCVFRGLAKSDVPINSTIFEMKAD